MSPGRVGSRVVAAKLSVHIGDVLRIAEAPRAWLASHPDLTTGAP